VHFLGRIDDMPGFYQALDIFCLSSLNEGLPLSPLEAQACGIPTAVTDVGGSREALCPLSGVLLPPGDSRGIARHLRTLLSQTRHVDPRSYVVAQREVRKMAHQYSLLRYTGA
jgi:glycosyltransferase involved in cell wall biosynthesis